MKKRHETRKMSFRPSDPIRCLQATGRVLRKATNICFLWKDDDFRQQIDCFNHHNIIEIDEISYQFASVLLVVEKCFLFGWFSKREWFPSASSDEKLSAKSENTNDAKTTKAPVVINLSRSIVWNHWQTCLLFQINFLKFIKSWKLIPPITKMEKLRQKCWLETYRNNPIRCPIHHLIKL